VLDCANVDKNCDQCFGVTANGDVERGWCYA